MPSYPPSTSGLSRGWENPATDLPMAGLASFCHAGWCRAVRGVVRDRSERDIVFLKLDFISKWNTCRRILDHMTDFVPVRHDERR